MKMSFAKFKNKKENRKNEHKIRVGNLFPQSIRS